MQVPEAQQTGGPASIRAALAVDFVVAPDVEKGDFLLGDEQSQCDSAAVGKPDRVAPRESAPQGMEVQVGLKRVSLQVTEQRAKARLQVGMSPEELPRLAEELLRSDDAEH